MALALFYSMPWIAVSEQSRLLEGARQQLSLSTGRIAYLFISVCLSSILFLHYNIFWKHRLWHFPNRTYNQVLNLVTNVAIAVAISFTLTILTARYYNPSLGKAFFIFYLLRNILIGFVAMLISYGIELIEQLKQKQIKILMLQHQNAETELAALKAQIDPHFFFNSMNSLNVLIRENQKEALEFVNHLSQSFRYILDNREEKFITLEKELRYLESYLFMMNKRFPNGLRVDMQIESCLLQHKIPQFALQIMLENAVKHNQVSERNRLHVVIYASEGHLIIKNNIQKKQSVMGYGIGLANLSKRYQLIGNLDIEVTEDENYFVVKLPFI